MENRNSALRPRISPPTGGNPSPTYRGHALALMIGNYRRHAPFVALVTQCVQKQQQSDIGGHLWILLWLSSKGERVQKGARCIDYSSACDLFERDWEGVVGGVQQKINSIWRSSEQVLGEEKRLREIDKIDRLAW
ncbi:hypothetical protein NPIL_468531 [Nephila pilipes]|uniref:Uncharacterized protein n=1 Tax=Nephila pilipes TaxID=299642 RepID=A0A8X6NKS8_NEPPI|nr:hypothetical protein NPIL_468531 [Nephila pilipes]